MVNDGIPSCDKENSDPTGIMYSPDPTPKRTVITESDAIAVH